MVGITLVEFAICWKVKGTSIVVPLDSHFGSIFFVCSNRPLFMYVINHDLCKVPSNQPALHLVSINLNGRQH